MRVAGLGWVALVLLSACASSKAPAPRSADENQLFGPVVMKLDTFTKVKDWSGKGSPDGVEALVEFDDRFGDRTKAAGSVVFELFDYRKEWPDPRGQRVVNPWRAALQSFDEQKAHWERASGAYTFRLAYDGARVDRSYVLSATFESAGGERFFAQIVLPAQQPESHVESPTTTPDSAPGRRLPEP